MTPRKPNPRKATDPAIRELRKAVRYLIGITDSHRDRITTIEGGREFDGEWLEEINKRLEALETRKHFRDASHDEPVSNVGEAIGQHFRIVGEPKRRWWRRFWNFMGSAA